MASAGLLLLHIQRIVVDARQSSGGEYPQIPWKNMEKLGKTYPSWDSSRPFCGIVTTPVSHTLQGWNAKDDTGAETLVYSTCLELTRFETTSQVEDITHHQMKSSFHLCDSLGRINSSSRHEWWSSIESCGAMMCHGDPPWIKTPPIIWTMYCMYTQYIYSMYMCIYIYICIIYI